MSDQATQPSQQRPATPSYIAAPTWTVITTALVLYLVLLLADAAGQGATGWVIVDTLLVAISIGVLALVFRGFRLQVLAYVQYTRQLEQRLGLPETDAPCAPAQPPTCA